MVGPSYTENEGLFSGEGEREEKIERIKRAYENDQSLQISQLRVNDNGI